MTITLEYCLRRATEIEATADKAIEPGVRAGYLELAKSFRSMAELAKMSDVEEQGLAERMVGNG